MRRAWWRGHSGQDEYVGWGHSRAELGALWEREGFDGVSADCVDMDIHKWRVKVTDVAAYVMLPSSSSASLSVGWASS